MPVANQRLEFVSPDGARVINRLAIAEYGRGQISSVGDIVEVIESDVRFTVTNLPTYVTPRWRIIDVVPNRQLLEIESIAPAGTLNEYYVYANGTGATDIVVKPPAVVAYGDAIPTRL